LKIALLVATVTLLSNTIAVQRDFRDSWILEDLEIPFVLFVVAFTLAFFSEKRIRVMVALAVMGRCVLLLIPNLKYVWFQGAAIDMHQQYGMANYVYAEGHIATQGPIGVSFYGPAPSIHVLLAAFSIVLGTPVVDSMKYIPVLLSPLYPLLTYVILKRLRDARALRFGGESALKYGLFFSSVPLNIIEYMVTGSQFGVLIFFLASTCLVMSIAKEDRRYWLLFISVFLFWVTAHSTSSLIFTTMILGILAIQKIPYFRMKSYLRISTVLAATLICAAWLMFSAGFTFDAFVRLFSVTAPTGVAPPAEYIPSSFFELARINAFEAFKTVFVYSGAELFLLLLGLLALIVYLRKWKELDIVSRFLFVVGAFLILLLPVGIALKIGVFRILQLGSALFPILAGFFVSYLGKRVRMRARALQAVIVFSILLLATLELYACQPLIPSANILSKDLPADEPLSYVNSINSIYQRVMIRFAENHLVGTIASDIVTGNQLTGLTEFNFSTNYFLYYYPLDKDQVEKKYDYFLIHLPGKSGPFEERAEIRTTDLIAWAICNSSVIYSNGESYVLGNGFTLP
jgi:hypothetical protein